MLRGRLPRFWEYKSSFSSTTVILILLWVLVLDGEVWKTYCVIVVIITWSLQDKRKLENRFPKPQTIFMKSIRHLHDLQWKVYYNTQTFFCVICVATNVVLVSMVFVMSVMNSKWYTMIIILWLISICRFQWRNEIRWSRQI